MIKLIQKITLVLLGILFINSCDNASNSDSSGSNSSNSGTENNFKQPYSSLLVYPKKKPINSFELMQHNNKKFKAVNFVGKWNLIFMGFTQCPDVCPTTLSDLNNIYSKLSKETQAKAQVIFLSVDPKRDTLEYIGKYLEHFNSDFIGVTGEAKEIDKLVAALGGIYIINNEDGKNYTVDHTARIFIVSPKAERYGIINHDALHTRDKTKLINDLELMLNLNLNND